MNSFEHIETQDLASALTILQEPRTAALAGGTDLLGELKRGIQKPDRLIDLKRLSSLKGVSMRPDLRLGALTPLSMVEEHPAVISQWPLLHQALKSTATLQLRNMGTVGGNLCQRPRCWYYRNHLSLCWLKGGEFCWAARGENHYHTILGRAICHASHPSDLAPALMALQSRIKIASPTGMREIALEELYQEPRPERRQMTILEPGELITEVAVPLPGRGSRGIYLKAMERKAWSFALVSVAAILTFDGDTITEGRLVLGGMATIPWRAKEAESILGGKKFSAGLCREVAESALQEARPLRDNHYKVPLAKALIRRALTQLADQHGTL
ncbi:MAG TPA: xanthine dehydrogenase family protein subunit M [Thermodesulfobacteriota bacterium]|nr:xanthine dehydrogenase family protein subunit M [Thermodesulfobacteriota bacterium]